MDADAILRELVEQKQSCSDVDWAAAFEWADAQKAAPPAAQPATCADGSMTVDEAIAGVLELFPGAGKQALQRLAQLLTKPPEKAAPPAAQPSEAQDAARYRWLRHCQWKQQLLQPTVTRAWWWSVEFLSRLESGGDLDVVTQGQELDAAIDEAMERQ